jgi:ring-1,2-phenylacetyl-CoA epoxidase subunit PaaB
MTADTQWPRYQVFEQNAEGRPHSDAGSVHAPDDETAMMTARDVFARRPEVKSLWVVRADRILSRTREELNEGASGKTDEGAANGRALFHVFIKKDHRATHVRAGEIEASTPEGALRRAVGTFAGERPLSLWIVAETDIDRSDPRENAWMFETARGKEYRDQGAYQPEVLMREIRSKTRAGETTP